MKAEAIVQKLFDRAKERKLKRFQVEYFYKSSEMMKLERGEISEAASSETQGFLFKVLINGQCGKYNATVLDEADIDSVIDKAIAAAELQEEAEEAFFYDGNGEYPNVKGYTPLAETFEKLDKAAFLKEVEDRAYKRDKRISQVLCVAYSRGKAKTVMRNSIGLDISDGSEWIDAGLTLKVRDNDTFRVGSSWVDFSSIEDFNPDKLVNLAIERAIEKIGAKKFEPQKSSVVFRPRAFRYFLGKLTSACSAVSVMEKNSRYDGKIGQRIAAKIVNIVDNPLWEGQHGCMKSDGEGVPAKRKDIIRNGVLKTYLHNLKTAHKYNVEPTGNGASDRKTMAMFFYLEAGKKSFEELLAEMKNGFVITTINSKQGVSLNSGNFSVEASGLMVKNGQIVYPVENFTLAGNFYDLFKDVRMIGNDFDTECSNIGSPSVLADGLTLVCK